MAEATTISGTPTIVNGPREVTVWWTTDVSSTTELHWGPAAAATPAAYANHSVYGTVAGLVHSRTLNDLRPGTYYVRAQSIDGSGNVAYSAELTFTVPSNPHTPLDAVSVKGTVNSVEQSGGTIYIGGRFNKIYRRQEGGASLSLATGVASTDQPQFRSRISAALDAGKVVGDGASGYFVAGTFDRVGALARTNIVHILPDGGVDPTWNVVLDGPVTALTRSGGTLYMGGTFTSVNAVPRTRAAAVSTSTGAVAAWDPAPNGRLEAITIAGSTAYIGGAFTAVAGGAARSRLAAVDATSGAAAAWDPSVLYAAYPTYTAVNSIDVSGSSVFVVGSFDTVNGSIARRSAAAFDATTGAATAWNPSLGYVGSPAAVGSGNQVLIDSGGAYITGSFTQFGASTRRYVGQVDLTTGAATAWNVSGATIWDAYKMAVSGGNLYLSGMWPDGAGSYEGIAAFTLASGAKVAGWTSTIRSTDIFPGVSGVAVSGSTVFAGGSFAYVDPVTRNNAAALDAATGAVTAWDPDIRTGTDSTLATVQALRVSGTTVYAAGGFDRVNGSTVRTGGVAAFSTTTATATAWNPAFTYEGIDCDEWGNCFPTTIQGGVTELLAVGSSVLVGGQFETANGVARGRLAAFDAATGSLEAWNPGMDGSVHSLESDGTNLWVGGDFTSVGGTARNRAASFSVAGRSLTSWNPDLDGAVYAIEPVGGLVYLGGGFTSVNGGTTRRGAAAVSDTTAMATAWNPDITGAVEDLDALGSSVYIGGSFTRANGPYERPFVAAVDTSSGAVTCWTPWPGATGQRVASVLATGTTVYLGHAQSGHGAGSDRQQGLATFGTANLGCPGQVDNQIGDTTWRNANTGSYDIDFSDPDGLAAFELQAWTGAGRTGSTAYFGWVRAGLLSGTSSSANWTLPSQIWGNMQQGTTYITVRVLDEQNHLVDAPDAFFVRKDTIAPNPVTTTTAPSPTASAPDLTWTAPTDATSGVDFYRVYRGTSSTGPWTQVSADGAVTTTSFTDAAAPSGTHWYRVQAVDRATNEQQVGNNVISVAATINSAPLAPTLMTPSDGTSSSNPMPALSARFSDPDAGQTGTLAFELCTADPSPAQTCVAAGGTVAASGSSAAGIPIGANGSWSPPALANGTYRWRARATDSPGLAGPWSATRQLVAAGGATLTMLVDAPSVNLGSALVGSDAVATSVLTITTDSPGGYEVGATDTDDLQGPACGAGACAGSTIGDWSGEGAAPTTWAAGLAGSSGYFGLTVLSVAGPGAPKLAKWGAGTSATDVVNNRYAGARTSAATLHTRASASATSDVITVAYRATVAAATPPGVYASNITYTATASP